MVSDWQKHRETMQWWREEKKKYVHRISQTHIQKEEEKKTLEKPYAFEWKKYFRSDDNVFYALASMFHIQRR